MKILFAGLLALLLSFQSFAQTSPLNKQKFTKDFKVFQSIFEQANAGLYKYHSKKSIDSLFTAGKKQINSETTFRDFYNIVWHIVDFTGSSHNSLNYPDSLDRALSKQKIFFPLPIIHLNGKIYSLLEHEQIPLGSEILSVNNVDAQLFIKNTSQYASTDGHNVTGKHAFMDTDWLAFYVYLAYGPQENFTIAYRVDDEVKTTVLESVIYKTAVANYKKRFVPGYEKSNDEDYFFKYVDEKTGLLNVNTFSIGGPKSSGHKKYALFLDSVFKDLKVKNIENLIVDVRQNGGGNDPNDLLLYSYLTNRNFRENTSAFTVFNEVPFKEFFVEEETDEIKDLEEDLKEEHNIFKAGKYYQNEKFNKVWEPNPAAFQNKVYLLISPFVASAGSLFASMIKSDERAVVVGKESLGGYYGHTGHIPVMYKLPHTKLLLTFSIVDLEQDVRVISGQKYGDGVKPDFEIEPTIKDYLSNHDAVLDYVKKLIISNDNSIKKK